MTTQKKTVYIIAGPTAVGKSVIANYLARRIHGEIVNCDSIQLYKYLDIGSAKPSPADMSTVPHHLYGVIDPKEDMTVARYQKMALETIDDILERGKTPILCGGTGLYLNSVLYDMDFAAEPADGGKRRRELEDMAEQMGGEYMYESSVGGGSEIGGTNSSQQYPKGDSCHRSVRIRIQRTGSECVRPAGRI